MSGLLYGSLQLQQVGMNAYKAPPAASLPDIVVRDETLIHLDVGDPSVYSSYWEEISQKHGMSIDIRGSQSLSYFAYGHNNLCWFMEKKLEEEIKRPHRNVGNAVVEDRYIVVGTGSSQLILAALYALCHALDQPNPISVVSAAPYYSSYPEMINYLRSSLFEWAGDAHGFNEEGPYIEIVTSPSNPDGSLRRPVVNQATGMVVHDFAYYWPQYTAITSPADQNIMLFTASKCTGHAGSRVGWAVVRDENIARRMVKFIEINTIGVSKEAQLRVASVLEIISLSCQRLKPCGLDNFFLLIRSVMEKRWKRLKDAINNNQIFSLPKFPHQFCNFTNEFTEAYPAFAWLKCKDGIDCEKMLRGYKIVTRGGARFGAGAEYTRVSMLSEDEEFDLFIRRVSTMSGIIN